MHPHFCMSSTFNVYESYPSEMLNFIRVDRENKGYALNYYSEIFENGIFCDITTVSVF